MVDARDAETETISVALSGGGVRASLFTLGVMMYLTDTGLNRRVRIISSVSGGSITNACIGLAGDFSNANSVMFRAFAGRLSHALAKQGSFFLPRWHRLATYVVTAFLTIFVLIRTARWLFPEYVSRDASSPIKVATIYFYYLLFAVVFTIVNRNDLQRRVYRTLLFDVARGDQPIAARVKQRRFVGLEDMPDSQVAHVICATELNSGRPMFFSQQWIHSPAYGWGNPSILLADAVYASAAFPALFPPLRLPSASMRLSGGFLPGKRPVNFVLADGGAYNNLATQWQRSAASFAENLWALDSRFSMPEFGGFTIVVNASAPPRGVYLSRMLVSRNFLAFLRILTVMYENTVRPRLSMLRQEETAGKSAVIDLAASPLDAAETLMKSTDQNVSDRAKGMAIMLKSAAQHYWIDFLNTTSTLRTTLAPVGFDAASGLVRHGYLNATVAMHAQLNAPDLMSVPPVAWFDQLVRDGTAHEEGLHGLVNPIHEQSSTSRLPSRW